MKTFYAGLSVLAASLFLTSTVLACTDVQITAQDGTQVVGRSMEFAMPLESELITVPKGTVFQTTAPDGKPGQTWTSKFGYVMVNGLKQQFAVDGMNDQGVAFEYLYLPGDTMYMPVPEGKNSQAIPYFYLGDWVLGNFSSIDDIRKALETTYVYQQTLPVANNVIFPLHGIIHDATGKAIVVEFVNGKMHVDDYVGVATNSPVYSWHVTNQLNYLNLSPYNPKPIVVNGVSYGANGEGAGMLGLPGDISPASRFVKMAFLRQVATPVADATAAVNLAQHMLNNVDIPSGMSRSKVNDKDSDEITQWTVFKDMTHKVFYFHSYNNMNLQAIDLNKLDLSANAAPVSMPIATPPQVVDMTEQFKASVIKPSVPVITPPAQ